MEVPLSPDLQSQFRRLAAQKGQATEALVVEAVERLVNHDAWFLAEMDEGLTAAERGELVDHATSRN